MSDEFRKMLDHAELAIEDLRAYDGDLPTNDEDVGGTAMDLEGVAREIEKMVNGR